MKNKNSWRLDEKVALVTGGSEGIGFAIAEEFISLGAEVIIASRSKDKLVRAKAQINSDNIHIVDADLSTELGRHTLIDFIEKHGKLDILVNNLGQADRDPFIEMNDDRIASQIEMNLLATLALTKSLYPYLKNSRGSVTNISSVAAQRTLPNRLWYGVVKAGLDQATKALAAEWAIDGIRVNAVSPWFTETPLTKSALDNPLMKEKILKLTPIGRVAKPSDIAGAVAFLSMPAASYVNGIILPVDGGYLAQGGLN
jgi:Tropinone reductase 1